MSERDESPVCRRLRQILVRRQGIRCTLFVSLDARLADMTVRCTLFVSLDARLADMTVRCTLFVSLDARLADM